MYEFEDIKLWATAHSKSAPNRLLKTVVISLYGGTKYVVCDTNLAHWVLHVQTLEAWRSHRLYTEYCSNDACFDRSSFKLSACHSKLFAEDPKFSTRSCKIVDFSHVEELHTLDLTSQTHRTKFPLAETMVDSIVETCVAPDRWSALCKLNFRGTLVDGETVGRFAEVARFCAQITHLDVGHTYVAEGGACPYFLA